MCTQIGILHPRKHHGVRLPMFPFLKSLRSTNNDRHLFQCSREDNKRQASRHFNRTPEAVPVSVLLVIHFHNIHCTHPKANRCPAPQLPPIRTLWWPTIRAVTASLWHPELCPKDLLSVTVLYRANWQREAQCHRWLIQYLCNHPVRYNLQSYDSFLPWNSKHHRVKRLQHLYHRIVWQMKVPVRIKSIVCNVRELKVVRHSAVVEEQHVATITAPNHLSHHQCPLWLVATFRTLFLVSRRRTSTKRSEIYPGIPSRKRRPLQATVTTTVCKQDYSHQTVPFPEPDSVAVRPHSTRCWCSSKRRTKIRWFKILYAYYKRWMCF